jgi:NADPH:quinone reductase-like Zn-dependent oxidoreductase
MKAIIFSKYGSQDLLEEKEIEKPSHKDDEVLIKVHAASVNSWDWELMRGTPFVNRLMFGLLKPRKIHTLGCDIAGQIEAVGKDIKKFQPGDKVFGDLSRYRWGGFAEFVCAPEDALALKSTSMTFEEAAAIPQAGLLALQGLCNKKPIQAGQKVLINGAGGGVGTFAVQIAKTFGAEVTGVDKPDKFDIMRMVGADKVIDYTQEDFTRNGLQYDMILDVAANHSITDYMRSLSQKGIFVMVGGSTSLANKLILIRPLISLFSGKQLGILMHKANTGLAEIRDLVETGQVKPIIDKRYPLSNVAEALRYIEDGHAKGKIIITIHNSDNT